MPSSSSLSSPPGFGQSNNKASKVETNQIISPASPLFLPLTQLNPFCSRLLGLVSDSRVSRKELIASESNLWREVKKLKALQDKASIFTYLIGYYHTILYQLVKLNDSDDIFQYHILIRLGDLNRYLDRLDIAEYYYCNARNLFPNYGHAFNQLGLLTRTDNFYKCCYYYARAAKSIKKPLDKALAESNLRLVIDVQDNTILNAVSNDDLSIPKPSGITSATDNKSPTSHMSLPTTAFEWFYLMVMAIYFDNIQPVAKPFMSFMNENFSIQTATKMRDGTKVTSVKCDRDGYLSMASLDLLLDWSRLGKQGKQICMKISTELRQMRSSLISIIGSLEESRAHDLENLFRDRRQDCPEAATLGINSYNRRQTGGSSNSAPISPSSMNVSNESSILSTKEPQAIVKAKLPALPHDCVLRGFKPLETIHAELQFAKELPVFNGTNGKLDEFGDEQIMEQSFIGPEQLMQILNRLKTKIDSLGPMMKRRTRNIALESILSNMKPCDSDSGNRN